MTPAVALSCREMVELVTDYLEGALPRRERRQFEQHLAGCEHCTAYIDQMRRTRDVLGRLTEESIPPHARDALLHAFRDWSARLR
jgi:anti-sigma factor (TIGR02949 family)